MAELVWPGPDPDAATYDAVHALVADVTSRGGAVGWLEVPDRAQTRAWLDEVLSSGARLVLAREGSAVLGCGYWQRLPAAVLRQNAEIRKVMTASAARGRGTGRQVVAALVDDARAAGIEALQLDVRGNNHAALGLYQSLGFVVSGRRPDWIAVGEHRFDQVLLHRDLRLDDPGGPVVVRHGGRREGAGMT